MPHRAVAISLAWIACVVTPAAAQRAVILVRHAEKQVGTGDVALSEAGQKRAQALATALKDAGVSMINTTNYARTRQTAAPLAAALGLNPKVVNAAEKPAALVKRLAADHRDQVVLIVGHSNTLPAIVDAFFGKSTHITIPEDEYSMMFILVPKPDGGWTVVRGKY